jgi:hypothetical protein
MIIYVDLETSPAGLELLEPDDFKGFKVVTAGGPSGLGEALAPIGELTDDAEHAFLRPEAVQELPGAPTDDEEWRQGFAAMVDYAAGHGWTDESGAVRAHVENAAAD